ncbi:MAG: hypothetical protein JWP14_3396 [Frankiales bacterium]|nr:hypothetical protein [Frankiales bacterium]
MSDPSEAALLACIYPACGQRATWRDGQGEWCDEHLPHLPTLFLVPLTPTHCSHNAVREMLALIETWALAGRLDLLPRIATGARNALDLLTIEQQASDSSQAEPGDTHA